MDGHSIKKARIEIDNDFDSSMNGGSHEILSAERADRDSPLSSPLVTPPPASQDSIDIHSSECESDISSIDHESDDDSGWDQFLHDTEHLTSDQLRDHVNHLIELHQQAEAEEDSFDEANETDVFAHNYISGWNGKRSRSFDV
tara:strand:+ start:228 stop:656 length:429 start_codon:yes stop_codon:yes gene_type:complete